MVKQVVLLLVVSILLGTAVARGVAEVANGYFHQTMDSLVGSYGEYDFIVQVQEEKAEVAKPVLERVLAEHFVGGRYHQAPAIGGRANFFVAIPAEYKSRAVYERIDSYFAVLPGAAGLSIISEPRLSIRGVPTGAVEMVQGELEKLDGVWFVFMDGSTMQVMLSDMAISQAVEEQVEMLLASYRLLEVRFLAGAEPASPARLGERLARRIAEEDGVEWAKYVSIQEDSGQEAHLQATLRQMRTLLSSYRSRVTVYPDVGVQLAVGEQMRIDGRGDVTVEVERVSSEGASGSIVRGDASEIESQAVYRVQEDGSRVRVATAVIDNPRQQLADLEEQVSRMAETLPAGGADTATFLQEMAGLLASYETAIASLEQGLAVLDGIAKRSAGGIADAGSSNLAAVEQDLERAIASVDNTRRWLNLAAWASQDVRELRNALEQVTQDMSSLNQYISAYRTYQDGVQGAGQIVAELTQTLTGVQSSLKAIDVARMRASLEVAGQRLPMLAKEDVSVLARQLESLLGTLPTMRDEEIAESIRLLDRILDESFVPNKRVQIMTQQPLDRERAEAIVLDAIGHTQVSISDSTLGVIEPNTYLEVYRMLYEVKRILAGLTAVVMTALFLVLDHTAIISMMKYVCRQCARGGVWRWTLPYGYGGAVGTVVFTTIFYLAGGGIPYVAFGVVPIIGAVGGLIVAGYSERISPISTEEVMAGQSLGMDSRQIAQEIVIPSGRPGLNLLLNRRNLYFR